MEKYLDSISNDAIHSVVVAEKWTKSILNMYVLVPEIDEKVFIYVSG